MESKDTKETPFTTIYSSLLSAYGPQGWWPVLSLRARRGYTDRGYHPGLFPRLGERERFEIIVGAILTQNTSWTNVERSLACFEEGLSPEKICSLSEHELEERVRSSGYFRQKAKKLKIAAGFFESSRSCRTGDPPRREDLLSLWGIGPETADSILLYAFNVPIFVVDAYTRRIFSRIGLFEEGLEYEEIRLLFESSLDPGYRLYQEYHALIVRHAKEHCKKIPFCPGCPLSSGCLSRKEP